MPQPIACIRVGMTAALTGRYQLQGRQALAGAQAWVADTNRARGIRFGSAPSPVPVSLTYYDDASDAQQCGAYTERLIVHDRVDLVLGPYSSGLALKAAEVAQRYQYVLWNQGGSSEAIYTQGWTWVVGILSPPSTYFHSVIDYVRATAPEIQRVTVIHSTAGAFPKDVAAGAIAYSRAQGLHAVDVLTYPAGTCDFTPFLQSLAAAPPTLLLSVGRIADDLRFAAQYHACGLAHHLIGLIATPLQTFADTLGAAASGFLGPSQWEPGVVTHPTYGPTPAEVRQSLMAQSDLSVDYPMAQAYAAGLVAQRCLEIAGTLQQQALRHVAAQLDLVTFYGRYRTDPITGRQCGHRMPVVCWQDGRKQILWPHETAHASSVVSRTE